MVDEKSFREVTEEIIKTVNSGNISSNPESLIEGRAARINTELAFRGGTQSGNKQEADQVISNYLASSKAELIHYSEQEQQAVKKDNEDLPAHERMVLRPFYAPLADTIVTPEANKFITEDHYANAVFHEAIHSTAYKERTDRIDTRTYRITEPKEGGGEKFTTEYKAEEIVAQLGAEYLSRMTGSELTNNFSASYINEYLRSMKTNTSFLRYLEPKAMEAVSVILNSEKPGAIASPETSLKAFVIKDKIPDTAIIKALDEYMKRGRAENKEFEITTTKNAISKVDSEKARLEAELEKLKREFISIRPFLPDAHGLEREKAAVLQVLTHNRKIPAHYISNLEVKAKGNLKTERSKWDGELSPEESFKYESFARAERAAAQAELTRVLENAWEQSKRSDEWRRGSKLRTEYEMLLEYDDALKRRKEAILKKAKELHNELARYGKLKEELLSLGDGTVVLKREGGRIKEAISQQLKLVREAEISLKKVKEKGHEQGRTR